MRYTSERRYYQKITDIYAECSADYDSKSECTKLFFKIVQNMMHLAVTHRTATEIVYERAGRDLLTRFIQALEKPFLDLTPASPPKHLV